ncbi:hypothetical protein [Salinisphaera sp. T5B8]|uniref:hypothetical protein n=1 Tax=Salinisphaera sp. T5B8 TaxID=1304154 RepID=UPI00333E320F
MSAIFSTARALRSRPVHAGLAAAEKGLSTYTQDAKDRVIDFAAAHIDSEFPQTTDIERINIEIWAGTRYLYNLRASVRKIHPRFYPQAVNP